jgi:DNA repair ATPase RecN
MVLTNKQREKLVLYLYNEGKTIKEIAKEAKMSFRDIGVILKEVSKQEEQTQMQSISSQAYKLFSEGKTALQVAIALNLNDHEVTRLYREYCNLVGLDRLNEVYQELKGNIWPFVNLHKSVKAAGMSVQHVVKLLSIAANDLPSVENRYELLKSEADKLEEDKRSSTMIFQSLSNQISSMRNTLNSICLEYQKEKTRLCQLHQRSFKQEALVRQFQNDNEEYLKITKTVKEKVATLLSPAKQLL